MSQQDIRLSDRFDLTKSPVLLNGTQALVRMMLMQRARDAAAGHATAGYVTGYRGSPLGAVDMQMARAQKELQAADILFQAGLNEDLAATALWGTQQAELRGEGRHDGVFGLWYGKGPGVDRSGDVMRHANMAGTSPLGGVIMAMGDDHTGESSTTLHQSDWALVDAYMPVLSPAGVQEILDYGLFGYALSRFAGVWVGLKLMKDTVEATAVVDARPDRMTFVTPDFTMPPGGLNIRLQDSPVAQEARVIDFKRFAAEAFGHANRIDRPVLGDAGARIGFVAAGKNWLDLVHAFDLLGLDAAEARRLGLATYKVGMTWPLDMTGFNAWARDLDLIVVVEEKRKLIEVQIKEAIFDNRRGRRVFGWKNDRGEELFPTRYALDPVMIAERIGAILIDEGRSTDRLQAALHSLAEARQADNATDLAARLPYFCAGCPHNSSTKVPEGHRAYAGIGCHYMVQWMDRATLGYTHMGGEGANWIGEAPFSRTGHVFQNLGDGTYNHSGVQAIRAALAAGVNITYKILFNDAVAMTGGQKNDGGLTPQQIVAELRAMGVARVAVVYDPKEDLDLASFPRDVAKYTRDALPAVQRDLAQVPGVSAIVYVQTCAAEKRRRRKRGTFPDPDTRVFINTDVCEGCGDCGVQSNCVAIVPVETPFGRKRAIDQSACNKDFSCLQGFCPSFVTLEGAVPKKRAAADIDLPDLPDPVLPGIGRTWNMVITGVGGTGVVTIGAVLAQAAQIAGLGAGMMEMAGLAQKGGAVHIHCRLAKTPGDIAAIRVAVGEADAVIGGDLVVTAGAATLGLMRPGHARGVVNSHETVTGDFTRNPELRLPGDRLRMAVERRLAAGADFMDATDIAARLMGDSIYSNMMLLGAAWQRGLVPIPADAIRKAIALNGAAVAGNLRAFELGRWAVLNPGEVAGTADEPTGADDTPEQRTARRESHLALYGGPRRVRRFRRLIDRITDPEMKEAVAASWHKLLTCKDEYEVARLLLDTESQARAQFDGDFRMTWHLSPPLLPGRDANGRPKKRAFGQGARRLFQVLAALRGLRGTPFDPFGYTRERRMERRLIRQFEADIGRLIETPSANRDAALALARLPLAIRGFGPVKEANAKAAAAEREQLLAALGTVPDALARAAE